VLLNLKTLYHLAKCSNEFYDFEIRISQHYGLPITADNSKFLDCLELVDTSTQKEQSIIANVSNSVCAAPKDYICNVNDDGLCRLPTHCDYQAH